MSNLLEKASILLTPTAYDDGKILSVKPEDGTGDFTFTRNSSATRVTSQGLIEDITSNLPRIDYSPYSGAGTCGHWLFEPQKTNLLTYSEQFDNASWINNGVTINANQVVSPDGALTADLLTGVSGGFGVVKFGTWTATNKVASCFAKAGSTSIFKIANVSGGNRYVLFDLSNGTVFEESTGWTGSIENLGNGWYRCTAISNSETGTFSLGVTAASESVYIWGAQLESDYKTSYIPTNGSTVTRLQDAAFGAGSTDLINSTEGVLYAEIAALSNQLTHRRISISDGTLGNLVYISFDTASNRILANANGKIMIYTVSDETEFQKIAVYYNTTAPKLFVNGVLRETETAMNAITGLNELAFDNAIGGSNFFGKTKCVAVFKEALTDAELTCLTTI
tara:strand:+ start:118 stop:1299 length:1182 start_codon:yes stop_codon:yes gene_type:complete